MIEVRRAGERHHIRHNGREVWNTFHPQDRAGSPADGFGVLENLYENRYPPGAGLQLRPQKNGEIITYVFEGTLAQEDSTGRSGVICAGEFQRMTAGDGIRRSETNASRIDRAHLFQIWLHPSMAGLQTSYEQKRFSKAERADGLCIVASPDGRKGSLCLHQNALVYSAVLDVGHHLVHELAPGRVAWLHVVRGEVTLGDLVLATGDGVGVTAEPAVSFTALEDSEILLLDIEQQPKSPADAGTP